MIFKIMGNKGDTAIAYDPATAEMKFNELMAAGMLPMVKKSGGTMEMTKRFDPETEEYTWYPMVKGG